MSNKDLLKERFIITTDYPGNNRMEGEIIPSALENYSSDELDAILFTCKQFPKIFKPLKWYEKRDLKDLPKYVKMNCYTKPCTDNPNNFELKKGQIFMPEKWGLNSFEMGHWVFSVNLIEPATEKEYLSSLVQL